MNTNRKGFLAGMAAAAAFGTSLPAAAADLNVGFIAFDPDAVAVYARDRGFFKSNGIDPKLISVQGAGVVASGLLSGSLSLGTMGVGTLAAARIRGISLYLVAPSGAITDASKDDGVFVLPNSPINTAADLSGKTVGIFSLRNMQQAVFLQWVEVHGATRTR